MVKDHSDSERGNPLPPHGQLFPINNKCSFICTIPQTGYHIPMTIDCASFIAMRTSRGMFNMSTDFVMVGVMVWVGNYHGGRTALVHVGRKEGNVLFDDALNTFYLRLYGVRHMVKDHFDSEK